MPKDPSLKKILVIGSGPIVIGQGCEFDYAGTQACRALREEGCSVVLINPNPATIMTDQEMAHSTYLEPIHPSFLEQILIQERPDALLPSVGGQTALNTTLDLHRLGLLNKYSVRVIGPSLDTIDCAENRKQYHEVLHTAKLPTLPSHFVTSLSQLKAPILLPAIVRASFTLSGYGGGIARTEEDLFRLVQEGLSLSPSGVLIEPSLEGWMEYELEVMKDRLGNQLVIAGIENIDPMGVHTGDSITVTPIQTLTDSEYHTMRRMAFALLDAMCFHSGGCNVQFALSPTTREMIPIEINPRVSRSSALASKATGYPIAKISTKLALGYTLPELTLSTHSAFFEPTLDYVVVKIPFFHFDKFPEVSTTLSPSMKAIGEVMGIGKNFQSALQKAIESLEKPFCSTSSSPKDEEIATPTPKRLFHVMEALRTKRTGEEIQRMTHYDHWFIQQLEMLIATENQIKETILDMVDQPSLLRWKQQGFSDQKIASLLGASLEEVRQKREDLSLLASYKQIECTGGELFSFSHSFYSTFDAHSEARKKTTHSILVLGSGANRIGQGIEFDYCSVHAVQALQEMGYEAIMLNCNPSTVSTDPDLSDRLYIEPLTFERIADVYSIERTEGVLLQFGGQTPLNLAKELHRYHIPFLGASFSSIETCENRALFRSFLAQHHLTQPKNGFFTTREEALSLADDLGYPLILRPSYIIGGSSIRIIQNQNDLLQHLSSHEKQEAPILMEEYLQDGVEVEVDALFDGTRVHICGIIEQFDPVGIHSGDSIGLLSSLTLSKKALQSIQEQTIQIGSTLGLVGLFNVQFCVQEERVSVLEVNPRASRTIPLHAKITGIPFVKVATKAILGQTCVMKVLSPHLFGIKIPFFPFNRFPQTKRQLGPSMYSTGEALLLGRTLSEVLAKAQFVLDTSPHTIPHRISAAFCDMRVYSLQEEIPILTDERLSL